jgi:hypothetical protein
MTTTTKNQQKSVPIYRFKFSKCFAEKILYFSKVHQYDNRIIFKEEWEKWVEENEEEYTAEITRLTELGYEGDVKDKIFKSARYYYRKKSVIPKQAEERRQYITIDKLFIDLIDNHIREQISRNAENVETKPSDLYQLFCEEYEDEFQNECDVIQRNSRFDDKNEIEKKIKKTYKNRYFLLVRKCI